MRSSVVGRLVLLGAILMLPEESADELLALQRQGFPFVIVDPLEAPPEGIPCVSAMHADADRHRRGLHGRRAARCHRDGASRSDGEHVRGGDR